MTSYMSSAEAAAALGVSRQTLYAYVSRGLLRAEPGPTHRDRQYLASDVERLAAERARARKPKEVAKATLNWGLPVLESSITLIENERLFYRGHDAIGLAATADLETLAALLWQCLTATAFSTELPPWPAPMPALIEHYRGYRAEESLLPLITVATDDAATAYSLEPAGHLLEGGGALVRALAACLLGAAPSTQPIHTQCATAWGVDEEGEDLIRMALVLCADHELNASGFTARCVASTGASLRASVIGGLAALTGGKHGAATAHVEAMWDEIEEDPEARIRSVVAAWQSREHLVPGFGHHLYPGGDPRATALLARILPSHPDWAALMATVFDASGQRPTIDAALVALRRHLRLPLGAAFGLFALGRSVGWIAHALEQRANDNLIRPRAAYTGPRPALDGSSSSARSPISAKASFSTPSGEDVERFGPFSGLFPDKR